MAGPIKAGGAGSVAAAVGSGKGAKLAQAGFNNGKQSDARAKLEKGTTSESTEQQMARCKDLEEAIEVLRTHYEHYFLGLVRQEPHRERDLLKKEIIRFKSSFIRNTAVKFRVASMHNRYLSYERMWQRTVQEIEDGTYRRDVFKAKLHRKGGDKQQQQEADDNAKKLAELTDKVKKNADDFDIAEDPEFHEEPEEPTRPVAPVAAPQAPRPPITAPIAAVPAAAAPRPVAGPPATNPGAPAAKPAAPAAGAPRPAGMPAQAPRAASGGLTDDKVKAIFDAYVLAKRHCKESTQGLTYDTLATTLRKQMPGLLDKHKAKAIDFKVVIKGGKAILKAVPK